MARVRMITRTINVTVVEVMCVDTASAEVSIKSLELTGETFTEDNALKELKKTVRNGHIQSSNYSENGGT